MPGDSRVAIMRLSRPRRFIITGVLIMWMLMFSLLVYHHLYLDETKSSLASSGKSTSDLQYVAVPQSTAQLLQEGLRAKVVGVIRQHRVALILGMVAVVAAVGVVVVCLVVLTDEFVQPDTTPTSGKAATNPPADQTVDDGLIEKDENFKASGGVGQVIVGITIAFSVAIVGGVGCLVMFLQLKRKRTDKSKDGNDVVTPNLNSDGDDDSLEVTQQPLFKVNDKEDNVDSTNDNVATKSANSDVGVGVVSPEMDEQNVVLVPSPINDNVALGAAPGEDYVLASDLMVPEAIYTCSTTVDQPLFDAQFTFDSTHASSHCDNQDIEDSDEEFEPNGVLLSPSDIQVDLDSPRPSSIRLDPHSQETVTSPPNIYINPPLYSITRSKRFNDPRFLRPIYSVYQGRLKPSSDLPNEANPYS